MARVTAKATATRWSAIGLGVWICIVGGATAQQSKPAAPALGVYSEAQAARGDAMYAENCAQCHTPTLVGGDLAPAITGPAFIARWTADKPLSELFDYLRTQMPLNSPGGLNAQHNADLVAFLLKKAGYPTGKTDLPASSEKLAGIGLSK
jgi:mono/diheme cytochrome c family protein